MDSAFLQASLFTSVVAYGVAAMAVVIGLLFALIGVVLLQAPKPASDGAHTATAAT
jgi:preprotein translocase subunit SecG